MQKFLVLVTLLGALGSPFPFLHTFSGTSVVFAAAPAELPPLDTDQDKLKFLIWLKERIPNLFSDAAKYDIDLFNLLDDQKKLVEELRKNPRYLELFRNRKYLTLTITPPTGGIPVAEVKLKSGVLEKWKEGLKNRFKEWSEGHAKKKPEELLEALKADLLHSIAGKNNQDKNNDLGRKFLDLRKKLSKDQQDRLKGLQKIEDKVAAVLKFEDLSDELRNDFRNIQKPASGGSPQFKPKDLAELLVLLQHQKKTHPDFTFDQAFDALTTSDLVYFSDKNDVLFPAMKELVKNDQTANTLSEGTYSNIHDFLSQTETQVIYAKDPILLREVTPWEGIFRGCTGGDCASQYSFPYPNDPHERVFFIYGKDNNNNGELTSLKGYVSATEVDADGKKSLYVITIAGNRVSGADAKVILLGLEKSKSHFEAKHILLPEEKNIDGLINFPEIKGIYNQEVRNKGTTPIHYFDKELRTEIEKFESDNNSGKYDHQENNKNGTVLSPSSEEAKLRVRVEPDSPEAAPFRNLKLTRSDAIEFVLGMQSSGRLPLVAKILALPEVKIPGDEFSKDWEILKNKNRLTVREYGEKLKDLEKKWGIDLKLKPHLTALGYIEASDAFAIPNLVSTHLHRLIEAEKPQAIKRIVDKKPNDSKINLALISFLDERTLSLEIVIAFGAIKPSDQATFEALTARLNHGTAEVRETAVQVLGNIKPADPKVHVALAQRLEDTAPDVRLYAAQALGDIKPADPQIHRALAECLKDTVPNVRFHAAQALGDIKPADPQIHRALAERLKDEDPDVRKAAFRALYEIKPSDQKALKEWILFFENLDPSEREDAEKALGKIEPSDLIRLLSSPEEEVRKVVSRVLKSLKLSKGLPHLKELKEYMADPCPAPLDQVLGEKQVNEILEVLRRCYEWNSLLRIGC